LQTELLLDKIGMEWKSFQKSLNRILNQSPSAAAFDSVDSCHFLDELKYIFLNFRLTQNTKQLARNIIFCTATLFSHSATAAAAAAAPPYSSNCLRSQRLRMPPPPPPL
jgi:hypothetical protein